MKVQIIQVPYDSGHRSVRMGRGPEYLIKNGIDQLLREQGHEVYIDKIEAKDPFQAEIGTGFELCRLISERVREAYSQKRFPLVLSGNCNSSLGTISGVNPIQLGIIWFDSHTDFHTPETDLYGMLDGMGLSVAAGLCWKMLAATILGFHPIPTANILHVGGRLLPVERSWFIQSGVAFVDAQMIRQSGLREALAPALAFLQTRVQRVYLHLDLDVLDPEYAPANEFLRPDGLTMEQVDDAIQLIREHFTISASGVASFDPAYDEKGQTLQAGIQLIKKIISVSGDQ